MEEPIAVEAVQEQPQPTSQLPNTVSPTQDKAPVLDDASVRAAIAAAEAQGQDADNLTIEALSQAAQAKSEVPEKFLKTDGEVDVEKLKASTRQLDEAIQQKEQKIEKTVEDYLAEYREKEKKFRTLPNPERLRSQPNPAPAPTASESLDLPPDQARQKILQDLQANPVDTIIDLIKIVKEKDDSELRSTFEDIKREKHEQKVRENIADLAKRDPRVLQAEIFAAISAKLESDPELWKLKNPHKAAWLEVKEELRLGEPATVQAQPSKIPSPILGGGTPPPAPSSQGVVSPRSITAAMGQVNFKDKKEVQAVESAMRELFSR